MARETGVFPQCSRSKWSLKSKPARVRRPFPVVLAIAILAGLLPSMVHAQPSPRPAAATVQRSAQEQRRDWVRVQIAKLVSNERERTEILARLNRLSDDQIQELAILCLDELEARRKRQFAVLREHNAREREAIARERAFREQLVRQLPPYPAHYYPGFFAAPVGFIPVITWLPEGASLSAQGVISPDGRHVRLNLTPFFSTIGPIYTFNFMTGETRRYDP